MKVAFFDPSTHGVGYCCATGPTQIISTKLVTPRSTSTHWTKRLNDMEFGLRRPITEDRPDLFVIEEPDPIRVIKRYNKKKKKWETIAPRGGAIYGTAVGMVYLLCRLYARKFKMNLETCIDTVEPREWTGGSSKEHRQLVAKSNYPNYDMRLDPGRDLSDAICLCEWWWADQRIKEMRK